LKIGRLSLSLDPRLNIYNSDGPEGENSYRASMEKSKKVVLLGNRIRDLKIYKLIKKKLI